MDNHFHIERSSGRLPLALYGGAIAIALGAAAIVSTGALAPRDAEQPVLIVSGMPVVRPDRIAGIIEPAAPIHAASVQAAEAQPVDAQQPKPAVVQSEMLAALPPKPLPRPCIECVAQPAAAIQQAAVAAVDPAPVEADYDVAVAEVPDGPVPPLPVGRAAGEGAGRGLLVRGSEAVISGSSEIVGAAWGLSGAAVGRVVRSVHQLAF